MCPPSFINYLPLFAFVKLESSQKIGCTNKINPKLFSTYLHNVRYKLHINRSLFENSNNDPLIEVWLDQACASHNPSGGFCVVCCCSFVCFCVCVFVCVWCFCFGFLLVFFGNYTQEIHTIFNSLRKYSFYVLNYVHVVHLLQATFMYTHGPVIAISSYAHIVDLLLSRVLIVFCKKLRLYSLEATDPPIPASPVGSTVSLRESQLLLQALFGTQLKIASGLFKST